MIEAYELTLVNSGAHIGPLHFDTEQDAFDFTVRWAQARYGRSDVTRNQSGVGQYVWSDGGGGDIIVARVKHIQGPPDKAQQDDLLARARAYRQLDKALMEIEE